MGLARSHDEAFLLHSSAADSRLLIPTHNNHTSRTSRTSQESSIKSTTMAYVEAPVPVNTCYLVKCDKCGKTTWKGCGQHVESVMKDVKEEEKCTCPR
ncbi:hypothetical protein A0H81_13778 [Grifola frondosa]|uniref:Uncharacterized protein n=1 Tax=Grifola frondosa TaxID=5627 RepID=A0A1C7LU05_GRIFR|nr:hypothetical protein A0H81_13778 [Grifola frondosa]